MPADAVRQAASGEIWGRTPFGSAWPQAQAYRGSLPPGTRGIEFMTAVPDVPISYEVRSRATREGWPDPYERAAYGWGRVRRYAE